MATDLYLLIHETNLPRFGFGFCTALWAKILSDLRWLSTHVYAWSRVSSHFSLSVNQLVRPSEVIGITSSRVSQDSPFALLLSGYWLFPLSMYVILLMAYGWLSVNTLQLQCIFVFNVPLMHGHHPLAFTEADWGTKSGGVQRTYIVTDDCHIALHFMYTPSFMLVSICNSFMLYKSLVCCPCVFELIALLKAF